MVFQVLALTDNHFPPKQEDFSSCTPQQEAPSPPQLHSVSMSFPRRAALIIAHAHPTPLCTSIARTGQLRAQAPHSMQEAGSTRSTWSFPSAKTACGHTCVQRLQLMHRPGSYFRLVSL